MLDHTHSAPAPAPAPSSRPAEPARIDPLTGLMDEYVSAAQAHQALVVTFCRRLYAVADDMAPALHEAADSERECLFSLLDSTLDAVMERVQNRGINPHG